MEKTKAAHKAANIYLINKIRGFTRTPIKFLKCTPKDIPISLQNINNWILWKRELKPDIVDSL